MRTFSARLVALLGAALLAPMAWAENSRYNFQAPASKLAEDIFGLHMLMIWICLAIFVIVFGFMFYSIFAHRKSKGAVAAQFHESTTVEILWTVIPVVILVAMAWPATRTVLEAKDTTNADITIKATGYQWKWGYDYLKGDGEGIRFISTLSTPRAQLEFGEYPGENYLLEVDNPVVVPVGKKVRILTTAQDVIHAWWVPALGVKQDAIPGFIRDTWFRADREGVFRGVCAELCGKDHGYMPIEVHVVSEAKYAEWTAAQKQKAAAPAAATVQPAAVVGSAS